MEGLLLRAVVTSMTSINVVRSLSVPLSVAWEELAAIDHHVEWMADAVRIDFVTDQHQGAGTRFTCLTKVGPLKTNDLMEITRWDEGHAIGVHHKGLITGEGLLELREAADETCLLSWKETLHFPKAIGGALTANLAQPILTKIWRGNLQRFEQSAIRRLESNKP
ncbi:SRPBCC family protein [Ferrimicrobium sp.]|uniref:SRPBCC family protein n=1 Tax=Ferrimicrobium sp. TaxID=2926050 RepID=UPI00260F5420|nr:SRPBCC family protein [Ferrimicrobium sp.]